VVTLIADDLLNHRVALSLLQVALSGVDAAQQRVAVGLVAVIDLGGHNRFGFQVDRVLLLVRQVRVALLHFHDAGIGITWALPVLIGNLLAFAFSIELPQVVVTFDLNAISFGKLANVRFPVLAGVLANDRFHRRICLKQSRIHTDGLPFQQTVFFHQ